MPTFTVMTWNVQNLFVPAPDAGSEKSAEFEQKLRALAAVIDQVQPQVLALQEIGPGEALARLQGALTHAMPHGAAGVPDSRGIRVAFLSTLPFEGKPIDLLSFPDRLRPVQVKDPIFDDPATAVDEVALTRMERGALEVTVRLGDTPVTVLNAHFKSKLITYERQPGLVGGNPFQPNDESERYRYAAYALFRRTAEAVVLRQRLNELLSDPAAPNDLARGRGGERAVIFGGDFNDEPHAATTQILQGPSGSEIGTGGFPRPDQGDAFRLWNLAPLLPPVDGAPPYTRIFKGRGELIDHLFASRRLVDPDRLPTAYTIMQPDPLPSIGDNPNAAPFRPGSDHAAVVAVFELE